MTRHRIATNIPLYDHYCIPEQRCEDNFSFYSHLCPQIFTYVFGTLECFQRFEFFPVNYNLFLLKLMRCR